MSEAPPTQVSLVAIRSIPEIMPGDDLGEIIYAGLVGEGLDLQDGDVVVVTQKVVSKAEGCLVELATVTPSARALALSEAQRANQFVGARLSGAR